MKQAALTVENIKLNRKVNTCNKKNVYTQNRLSIKKINIKINRQAFNANSYVTLK